MLLDAAGELRFTQERIWGKVSIKMNEINEIISLFKASKRNSSHLQHLNSNDLKKKISIKEKIGKAI